MLRQKLNDGWQMHTISANEYLNASVPGSVYSDLIENHKMEDPYYRDNELKALKLMDQDYEYRRNFSVSKKLLMCEEVILHFDGLDTLADIFINGQHIAYVYNMHRTWEFEVKKWLREENNELRIIFHSPTKFIEEADKKQHIGGSEDAMRGFPQLRKAHCMFGWDWGPRLPDMGIWRDVKLLGIDEARIESVYIAQEHQVGKVTLKFSVDIARTGGKHSIKFHDESGKAIKLGYSYQVVIIDPDGNQQVYNDSPQEISVENPKLWWPNGYGDQPLYIVKLDLICGGRQEDAWERRIGLRSMILDWHIMYLIQFILWNMANL